MSLGICMGWGICIVGTTFLIPGGGLDDSNFFFEELEVSSFLKVRGGINKINIWVPKTFVQGIVFRGS